MNAWNTLGVVAAGAGLASVAADAAVLAHGGQHAPDTTLAGTLALAEPAVLLVLGVLAVRGSRTDIAVAAGALTGAAVPLWLLRFGPPTWSGHSVGGYAAWGMLSVIGVAVGLYLRDLDNRPTRAAFEARRVQRLELADDLHDFVVHDINEMLLQAQAGQILADGTEAGDELGDVLRRIERTALRALTTVDRTIQLLHAETAAPAGTMEPDAGGAPRLPKPTVNDLPDLVDRFTASGSITVRLDIDPELAPATGAPPALPPEVDTTAYRIVVEALTNVRRHATGAGHVRVELARTPGDQVRVEVIDDGRSATRAQSAADRPGHDGSGYGGHGLAGLAARVAALSGTLSTGPAEPVGWRVTAVLPLGPQPAVTTAGR